MSDFDDFSDLDSPPVIKSKQNGKRISIERIYQKKSQLEHILLRPDTYIGSVEIETKQMWVWDEVDGVGKMVYRDTSFVPGLYKIFDEILVNAADNKQRDKKMNCIKIDINPEKNEISIYNNGKGIPVTEHKDEKLYVPTMIFGHLLTSSNYDDDEKKVVGGRNGYGAKLCNIFSNRFKVETSCKEFGKAFSQVWTENMKNAKDVKITSSSGEDFTRITFQPDLSKFKMTTLDKDIVALFSRRAFDIAGSTRGVKVFLNGTKVPINGFKDYVELFVKDKEDETGNPIKVAYEVVNERWEIAATVSDRGFLQNSFVNSIATTRGGKHVDYIADQIVTKLADIIKKKNKQGVVVKPFQIKNHLWVFVNCLIENPTFDSQTKETMTLQQKNFGSKCSPTDKFFTTVIKVGVVEAILSWVKFKAQTELSKKCHSKKHAKLTGIPKLEDANDAGTRNSIDCTLILTEGDSAKSLVVAGLGVIGRDKYGVFPLRGKMLNVREASHKQILENAEINNIIKIVGLQYKKAYTSVDDLKTLRYGKIMIMTDQDQDGSHIKGLLINFIHHNWPSLLKLDFLEEFITPIVKASKGSDIHSFYSLPEFEEWKKEVPNWRAYKIKYYKGLGTSTSAEAKEYFSDMNRHRIKFVYAGTDDDHFVQLAFSKKMVEQRKEWLTNSLEERKRRRELSLPEMYLYEKTTKSVSYKDFVNKELILFSNMDNERSIPSMMDGLKPGQRKVLFTCFKRNDKREVKVAQLAGSVGEHSAYHHGEASLMSTIINLAQNFVGSNNINLLLPIGQFGTRLQGGKDAASARYIFTMLNPLTRKLFSNLDEPLLNYLFDDNLKVEPEYYVPIIPTVLVNGSEGIGTGWSTKIPNYNPREIVENIRRMIRGEEIKQMKPWFKGFTGTIEQIDTQRFIVNGEAAVLSSSSFEITELPIRVWTQSYKESVLEVLLNGNEKNPSFINDYKEYHTDTTVKFIITLSHENLQKSLDSGLHKTFKIQTSLSTTSMVLFDANGCLRKYETPEEILREFFPVRLEHYVKRKAYYEGMLEAEAKKLENQSRFILEKNDGLLIMENIRKKEFVAQLIKRNYDSDPVKAWKKKNVDKIADNVESNEDSDSGGDVDKKYDFDYLFDMSMRSMLREKVDELLKLRDQKKDELYKLRRSTPEDLWENDLKEFLAELDSSEQKERQDASNSIIKQAKSKNSRNVKTMKFFNDYKPSADGERVIPKLEPVDSIKKSTATKKDKDKEKEKVLDGSDIENGYVPLAERLGKSPDMIDKKKKVLDSNLAKTENLDLDNKTTKKRAPKKVKTETNGDSKKKVKGKGKKKNLDFISDTENELSKAESDDDDFNALLKITKNGTQTQKKIESYFTKKDDLITTEPKDNKFDPNQTLIDSDDDLFNDKPLKPQEKKKTSEELFDSLFTPSQVTKPVAPTKPIVRVDSITISDSGSDEIIEYQPKPTKTKKKTKKLSSDDNVSDEFEEILKPKASVKKPVKQRKKKKQLSSDSEDDLPTKKSKNKTAAKEMEDAYNEVPPEFRTKTGRLRQPVNYNLGTSSESEF
ncbi:hypothetical protein RDWZM_008069 [Blomia tropicalis]|uniref:DNA topoisomerase 2 n=1 Tax=Blomia tropicalis TaxID=40697 RepID=A0A9Q0M2U9_BLOTA|nr:DNA topoisomerase 2-beta [Blomia tropicalis]KAJ6216912.1 hypothetical protein RDWZM_008069 [Blomia tropicalis]